MTRPLPRESTAASRSAIRSAIFDERRRVMEILYRCDMSLSDIAQVLGTTANNVGRTINRLRHEDGIDLPYRYALQGGKRVPGWGSHA